ncbi:hypothetical protein D0N37_15810 [Pseudoalteromonas piscicida]|nr:polysaccharide pyruvyl transferase family protein [Pseudoalteromonas piscicida]AXQ99039.1 hypothetical protein D0N37_15810 [Pseudoalteromonas piscicida]
MKLHESADIVFTSLPNASVHSKKYKALLGIPCLSVYNTYNPKVDRESYYKIWLDFLVDNGVDIKSCKLVYTTKEDYIETLKFEAYFSSAFGFDLEIENCHTLNDFNSVLSEAEIIISGRMHALILGLNHGAKNLVFPISDKLEEYSLMCSGKGEIEYIRSVAVNETIDFLSRFLKNDVK